MSLQRFGGIAALTCGATYLVGFALLATFLAPMGYGTSEIDAQAVVAFIHERPAIMLAWNTTIYIVNALALVVLVVALRARVAKARPGFAEVTLGFGLVWAALVLGAGMLANVAVEQANLLYATDPSAAAARWQLLHNVELGLGGGNEIAGGIWILSVSLAAVLGGALTRWIGWLGVLVGASGLATVIPTTGDVAGAVFGLGAILWFLAIGAALTLPRRLPQTAAA